MTNSPIPASSSENPGSVGLPGISSPLPSVPEVKKEPSYKISPPSAGYHSGVSASDNSVQYSNSGIPSIKAEPAEDPQRGAVSSGGLLSLPTIKTEVKEEPMSSCNMGKPNIGVNNSPLTHPNSQATQPQSVASVSEMETSSSALSSPLEHNQKDLHTATPPSMRSAGPLSQDSGVPSLPDSKPSPQVEETKKVVPAGSLQKGNFLHFNLWNVCETNYYKLLSSVLSIYNGGTCCGVETSFQPGMEFGSRVISISTASGP